MIKSYTEYINERYEGEEINIDNIDDLKEILDKYNVNYSIWGKGYAKTLEHLLKEIESDECQLKIIDKELFRFTEFVGIDITYDGFRLKEDYQKFKDGRVRNRESVNSVSEKMIMGENSRMAAIRGIEEELGITINSTQLMKVISDQEYQKKNYGEKLQSYPGLNSMYKQHLFSCVFTEKQFNPDGYIEVQKDKSTYFKWIPKV